MTRSAAWQWIRGHTPHRVEHEGKVHYFCGVHADCDRGSAIKPNALNRHTGPDTASPGKDRQSSALYDALLLDHIKNARNYRLPERPARAVTGSNVLCGDELTLYLVLENERIDEIAFQCSCCGICMASASVMSELVKGRTRIETAALLRDFIDALGRRDDESVVPLSREQQAILHATRKYRSRAGCASLPWTTLRGALCE